MITIQDVRKKLGKRAENMTDRQIGDLLTFLRTLCNKTIDSIVENKL